MTSTDVDVAAARARAHAERQACYRQRKARGLTNPRETLARAAQSPRPDPVLAELAAAVLAPNMPQAACRGRGALFSPAEDVAEDQVAVARLQMRAIEICGRCVEMQTCRAWVMSLPERERPVGVIAGQINNPREGNTK